MINLGLCLGKPHQSLFSLFRCCVLANPGQSSVELGAQIKREIPLLFRKGQPLQENFRALLEARLGNLRQSAPPLSVEHRNCAACARMGYHAEIYNFPWLVKCPIHTTEAITSLCPVCASKWSMIPKRRQYQCHVCGNISLHQLVANGAFESELNYSRLDYFIELVKTFENTQKYCLHSGAPQREPIITLGPTDFYFPSVVAAIQPISKNKFIEAQVQLHPCLVKPGNLERKVNVRKYLSSRHNDLNSKAWMTNSEHQIASTVLTYLAPFHSCRGKVNKNSRAPKMRPPNVCSYCVAFRTWQKFLCTNGSDESPKIDILAYDSHRFYLAERFDTPEPLQFLWPYDDNDCYSTQLPEMAYLIPQRLQQAIYEAELWTSFLNTLTIVKMAFARTSNLVNDYPKSIPNLYRHPLRVYITIDSSVNTNIIIPRAEGVAPSP